MMTATPTPVEPRRQSGFALIEIAIALIIIGLLLGSGLTMLGTQVEQQRNKDAQKALSDIREALIGYAAAQPAPHLPCPDKTNNLVAGGVANDGLEDVNLATGLCLVPEGNIPWRTLGVADADPWGHRYHYRVTPTFSSQPPAAVMTLASVGTLRVCADNACAVIPVSNVPAVILSYGPNGLGAITTAGAAMPAPVSADEQQNANADDTFVSHNATTAAAVAGEFDDLVTWLPTFTLTSRLLQAGKLP